MWWRSKEKLMMFTVHKKDLVRLLEWTHLIWTIFWGHTVQVGRPESSVATRSPLLSVVTRVSGTFKMDCLYECAWLAFHRLAICNGFWHLKVKRERERYCKMLLTCEGDRTDFVTSEEESLRKFVAISPRTGSWGNLKFRSRSNRWLPRRMECRMNSFVQKNC